MSSDFLKLVGEHIRTFRKKKGYTQESISEKSGIYITYISDESAANETFNGNIGESDYRFRSKCR